MAGSEIVRVNSDKGRKLSRLQFVRGSAAMVGMPTDPWHLALNAGIQRYLQQAMHAQPGALPVPAPQAAEAQLAKPEPAQQSNASLDASGFTKFFPKLD